jgi:integrase
MLQKPMSNKSAGNEKAAIYSPENLQRLVSVLWNSREESATLSALLYVALGAFAGLRPAEAVALEWKHIDFSKRQIVLTPPTAKSARVVPMRENLQAMLLPFERRSGLVIMHKKVANLLRNECVQAGVRHISNGLRRSYGCYRLGESTEDVVRMETGLEIAHPHEWKAVPAAEAAKYWAIRP